MKHKLFHFIMLLLIWLAVTAYNIDKAYHIDDAAHLEIAQWIAANPHRPMSGLVNWGDDPEPIFNLNQPHLYFYALAGWGKVFGYSERAMHVLQSLFSFVAILFFYLLAASYVPSSHLLLTALFALSPAFVINQNLMADVPVISLWLMFFYLLTTTNDSSEKWKYPICAVIASAALLIKYSSLILLPILFLHILIRRKYELLYLSFMPLALLGAWSLFNYLDYGDIHILKRRGEPLSFYRLSDSLAAFIVCMGAIVPFSFIFFQDGYMQLKAEQVKYFTGWLFYFLFWQFLE